MYEERPLVFINCAMSADGKIALPSGKQLKISGEEDLARVHLLRNEADAIVVGVNTVLMDDPKLTVKKEFVANPRSPLRVVMDSRLRTPQNALVLNPDAETLIATTEKGLREKRDKVERLRKRENTVKVKSFGKDKVSPSALLSYLSKRGCRKVFIEGGGTVMMSFLKEGLVDRYMVFVGSLIVGGAETPTPFMGKGFQSEKEVVRLHLEEVKKMDDGVLLSYSVRVEIQKQYLASNGSNHNIY